MAKYKHSDEPEEEYIDLNPILEGLYIDKTEFDRCSYREKHSLRTVFRLQNY